MADDHVDPEFIEAIMSPMVEAFVQDGMEEVLITCNPVKDSTSWCASHDSLWMQPEPTCKRRADLEDVVLRGIIAWEVRHGR